MLALLLSSVLTCLGALALGQGALALCGARRWNWLAVPVGLAVLMLLAVPAIHVPGRAVSTAVVTVVLILAALVLMVRSPAHRPPLTDLLAGLPPALLALVPFVVAGRAGTIGVSVDNDMGPHLLLAEAYRSHAVAAVTPLPPGYPLGPHALVATIAEVLGIRTDLAFAGLIMSGPILLGWTALACVKRAPWLGRVLAATMVGMPFLIAGYYAEGSFKELFEAQFVLAAALMLGGFQPALALRRWIPLALVTAGTVSVYSIQGVVWPMLFVIVALAGSVLAKAWRRGLRAAWGALYVEIAPGAIGLCVLVLVLLPQIPRVLRFVSGSTNNGIAKTDLGNLLGPLPGWEAFGIWGNPDFRMAPLMPLTTGMWTAFVLALVILGLVWALRERHLMLPTAVALAFAIWAYSNHSQSPYVAAKALVIVSPLLLLLAVLPLLWRASTLPSWWPVAASALALVLFVKVTDSSFHAVRDAEVGPTNHLVELRSLRPLLGNQSTLFLGDDDFIRWELAGSAVTPAYINHTPQVALNPEKAFSYGQALDFDTISTAVLNGFTWVITTRDAAASEPPPEMRLERLTADYALWRRTGTVQPRSTLSEAQNAGSVLDCSSAAGRTIVRRGGIAAVRKAPVEVIVPPLTPGARVTVTLTLGAGDWELETPYQSPLPVRVSSSGLRTTLPASLDSPGPRWPIGQVKVGRLEHLKVTFSTRAHWLTPSSDVAVPNSVIATRLGAEHIVPLASACGKLVDWYRGS